MTPEMMLTAFLLMVWVPALAYIAYCLLQVWRCDRQLMDIMDRLHAIEADEACDGGRSDE